MASPDNDFSNELKNIREMINWEVEKERRSFFDRLLFLLRHWEGQLPDLRDILRTEEIDWLLTEEEKDEENYFDTEYSVIEFVFSTGYRDEPEVDEGGKPLSRRSTALHYAAKNRVYSFNADRLFDIYDKFDVNYTDESGLTHYHVACKFGYLEIVEKFLELGQDPNLVWPETGDTPLHLALSTARYDVLELLLRNGADPRSTNSKGMTPLHVISKGDDIDVRSTDDIMKIFFRIVDELRQTIQIDARDKLGRTPLQWAVASLSPDMVDVLLARGVDLSDFVFPDDSYFGENYDRTDHDWGKFTVTDAFKTLIIVDRLEKRGYELDRSEAVTIMKLFAKHGLFENSANLDTRWCDDKRFARKAKKVIKDWSLSLYDLVRLRPKEVEKIFTITNSLDFLNTYYSNFHWKIPARLAESCIAHLGEIITRRFYRRWALDPFLELTHYRLPILCCEVIVEKLMNRDLYRICLAAAGRST